MATAEETNADMLAFSNGKGGYTWVARQEANRHRAQAGNGRVADLTGRPGLLRYPEAHKGTSCNQIDHCVRWPNGFAINLSCVESG